MPRRRTGGKWPIPKAKVGHTTCGPANTQSIPCQNNIVMAVRLIKTEWLFVNQNVLLHALKLLKAATITGYRQISVGKGTIGITTITGTQTRDHEINPIL